MIDNVKVAKLIPRLKKLVAGIEHNHDLLVHKQVNQFYYMQKLEELKELLGQLEEGQQRLEKITHRLGSTYKDVFHRWNKDARWLARKINKVNA